MARIYAGELSRLDQEIIEAVKGLPDDFWVLFEVTIERNIDVFIIRPVPQGASTLIVTEMKRFGRPVMGGADGPWMVEVEAGRWEDIPADGRDINPYWQAVNAANAMREWLWNNQRLYLATAEVRKSEDFKVWPDVLLLSPPGTVHRLPISPPSRYGRWLFSVQEWVEHVRSWTPKVGVPLTHDEVAALVRALRLQPLWNEYRPESATGADLTTALDYLRRLEALLLRIDGRLARQDERLSRLERLVAPATEEVAAERELTPEERAAIREAVATVRGQGKSRALPTILLEMSRILGYSLKERQYNGFGTASAMFAKARADGLIQFGPLSGPNPTIYLADEPVPAA
jgi:hypothetical protein